MNAPGCENIKTSQVAPSEGKGENLQVEENKNEQGQEIQLFVECKDLVKTNQTYVVVLKSKETHVEDAKWNYHGQYYSETVGTNKNRNPKWFKHFNVQYDQDKDIDLTFLVYKSKHSLHKEFIGDCKISLS